MTERLKQFASQLTGSKSPMDQMYATPQLPQIYPNRKIADIATALQRTQTMS